MTTPREHADDKTEQTVTDALRRAFSLGKTYWQQAHSDFISQHVKADATRAKFQELCERTEDTIDTLRAQLDKLTAENEQLREQRNRIGLCIGHALSGGRKDDHEAGLSERMNAIRALIAERNEWQASRIAYANEFPLNADGEPDVVNVHANIRSLKAQLAEAQKDAERLDWIERLAYEGSEARGQFWGIGEVTIAGLTFRAAIDAAKGGADGIR